MVGQGRGGKTELWRALQGRKFAGEDSVSTVGADTALLEVVKSELEARGTWKESQDRHTHLEEATARLVCAELRGDSPSPAGSSRPSIVELVRPREPKPSPAAAPARPSAALSGVAPPPASTPEVEPASEVPGVTTSKAPEEEVKRKDDVAAPVQLNEELVLEYQKDSGKEPLKFSVWDFGGQEVFYTLHHLFLSEFGVYLVCFNMQWLSKAATDEDTKQCLEFLKFWLDSIAVHTKDARTGKGAKILLVGTHKDKVKERVDHEAISERLNQQFRGHPAWPLVVAHANHNLNFFAVDNTKGRDDATIRTMMETIEREVEQEEYVKTEMPLEWIAVFDELRRDKRTCISFEQLQSLAHKHGLPAVEEEGLPLAEEVKCMAKVFSGLGFIMYHDEPSLSHLVVLNPAQFLIRPAARLICQPSLHKLKEHEVALREHPTLFSDYESMGIFDSRLFAFFWQGIDNQRELQVLMIKFGLLVPILPPSPDPSPSVSAAAPTREHRYFIPALLSKDNSRSTMEKANLVCFLVFASNEHMDKWEQRTGHITLDGVQKNGFFPSGLFPRLVGKALATMQQTSERSVEQVCEEGGITADCAYLSYGGDRFRLVNLRKRGCVRIDVLVDSSQQVMRTLLEQARAVIAECVKNLRCNIAVPEDGGAAAESENDYRDWKGRLVLLDGPKGLWKVVEDKKSLALGTEAPVPPHELTKRFKGVLPPWLQGLLEWYHAFLSYRWTQGLDDEIVEGLFYSLSRHVIHGVRVRVFLDRRRLEDGRDFVADFADALKTSQAIVPVVSHKALQRMFSLEPDSPVDNLLLEWTLSMIEMGKTKEMRKLQSCFPVMFGSMALEPLPGVTSLFDGDLKPSKLPKVVCKQVLAKAQELGGSTGAGAELTVHDVVARVLKFQGHRCWETRVGDGPDAEARFKKQLIEELTKKVLGVLESIPSPHIPPPPPPQPAGLQERCKQAELILFEEEGSGGLQQRIKALEEALDLVGQGSLVKRLDAIEAML